MSKNNSLYDYRNFIIWKEDFNKEELGLNEELIKILKSKFIENIFLDTKSFYQELNKIDNLKNTQFIKYFNNLTPINSWGTTFLEAFIYTNISILNNVKSWDEILKRKSGIVFLEYMQCGNINFKRNICGKFENIRKSVDDPFWKMYYPPNHIGCNAFVVEIGVDEIEIFKYRETKRNVDIEVEKGFEGNCYYWNGIVDELKKMKFLT